MTVGRTISVVVPAYNEEECIDELAHRLSRVFDLESSYSWSTLLVENGSTDSTWEKIRKICEADERFRAVRLARNFRMDGGLTAGLEFVASDACILMTADLQDPPELIPTLVRKWEEGYENVYGLVEERQGIGRLRAINSRLFYLVAARLTDNSFPKNASDFRLLDRKVYQAIRGMEERNRFLRGLVGWTGFSSFGVPFTRPPRFAGSSKAHTRGVLELAFKGIFAHSYKPLRLITLLGMLTSALAFLSLLVFAGAWFLRGVPFAGFGSLMSAIILLFGVVIFMLGIISEYIGLIYEEVKQRPNFVVRETIGVI